MNVNEVPAVGSQEALQPLAKEHFCCHPQQEEASLMILLLLKHLSPPEQPPPQQTLAETGAAISKCSTLGSFCCSVLFLSCSKIVPASAAHHHDSTTRSRAPQPVRAVLATAKILNSSVSNPKLPEQAPGSESQG